MVTMFMYLYSIYLMQLRVGIMVKDKKVMQSN
jgi:hypothetical protein